MHAGFRHKPAEHTKPAWQTVDSLHFFPQTFWLGIAVGITVGFTVKPNFEAAVGIIEGVILTVGMGVEVAETTWFFGAGVTVRTDAGVFKNPGVQSPEYHTM